MHRGATALQKYRSRTSSLLEDVRLQCIFGRWLRGIVCGGSSVVKQAAAGEDHDDAIAVRCLDDLPVTQTAAGLDDIARPAFAGSLDIIAEGEEGIAAAGHAAELLERYPAPGA